MGHSAGGHLALLYAYKAAAGHSVNGNPMHPISLVISEAGPILFAEKYVDENGNESYSIHVDNNICAMLGITNRNDNRFSPEELAILADASPYCVAQNFNAYTVIPYTILAYGKGIISATGEDGDGLIPIEPAIGLYNSQTNSQKVLADLGNESGYLYSTANDNCILYYFYGVNHGEFGDDKDVDFNDTINPKSSISNVISYYNFILSKLSI
ncbi:MAG: hypothetical protein E7370_03490 [Clostridiales bacterium]|nr:hypothetical protein [Clostridiales bacterium]